MSFRNNTCSVLAIVFMTALLATLGCHRTFKDFASHVNMADPAAAGQLHVGFYPIESKAWRWTRRKFSVLLKPPPGSEHRGGELRLHLYISAGQFQKLGPMTLGADAGGYPLTPETFSAAGPYIYARDMPPQVLDTNLLPIEFSFDKAAAPSETDARELAAVVSSVEIQSK